MDENRQDALWNVLTDRRSGHGIWECAQIACDMAAEVLPLDSFSLSLHLPAGPQDVVAATDPWAVWLDELQYVLGEGPAMAAFATQRPVLVTNLSATWSRWPGFCTSAGGHGAAAAYALPVAPPNRAPLAVLTGYQRRPMSPSAVDELADAMLLSELAARALLDDRTGVVAAARSTSHGYLGHYGHVVIAAVTFARAHDLTDENARALLRAYAFTHDMSVIAVADALLSGELRLEGPTSN